MSTLTEIEAAAKQLPDEEKESLLLSLAAALREARKAAMPPPRKFTVAQMRQWIDEDERDFKELMAKWEQPGRSDARS